MADVIFDGTARLIIVNTGITELSARDVYSWWKQWVLQQNANWLPAFSTSGGDTISPTTDISAYYFLLNDWRLRPYEAEHQLVIDGNIFVDGGVGVIVVPTLGNFNVLVTSEVSPQSQTVQTGVGTPQEVKDAVWEADLADYENQDDTAGQDVKDTKRNTGLIPASL